LLDTPDAFLEPLLVSRGFDIAREITFTLLADDSIVLTQ
jgi:hypothetical protein